MSDCLIHLTEKEFSKYLENLNASSVDYEGSSFNKGFTFSLAMQEQAIKHCQKFATQKLKSLLVKGRYGITVWIQAQSSKSEEIKLESLPSTEIIKPSDNESSSVNFNAGSNNSQENITSKIPIKKVTRVYRGQTYEVEIPDYSTIQNISGQQKPRRKYRGQYVD